MVTVVDGMLLHYPHQQVADLSFDIKYPTSWKFRGRQQGSCARSYLIPTVGHYLLVTDLISGRCILRREEKSSTASMSVAMSGIVHMDVVAGYGCEHESTNKGYEPIDSSRQFTGVAGTVVSPPIIMASCVAHTPRLA